MRLQNKVAIITGAGSGIGAATAKLFAQEGAQVVLMGRKKTPLREVCRAINLNGGQALNCAGDVRMAKDCEHVVKFTAGNYGKLDILVNNAGIGWGDVPHRTRENVWDAVLDTNLKGMFLMTKYAVPEMLKQGKGSIVNISSILGLIAMPASCAYNASKGGVIAFTRSVAIDYAKDGIRCNCICPGGVETPMLADELQTSAGRKNLNEMHPLGRMGQPIDVARAILYFASDESSWVTGSVLPVDGGYTAQ